MNEAAADGDGHAAAPSDLLDVGAFIRTQRERAKMSVRKLAELAEVSNPYLSQIERGLRKPSAEVLQQLARALRVSAEQLYVRAGIVHPDPGQPGSVELMPHVPNATVFPRVATPRVRPLNVLRNLIRFGASMVVRPPCYKCGQTDLRRSRP